MTASQSSICRQTWIEFILSACWRLVVAFVLGGLLSAVVLAAEAVNKLSNLPLGNSASTNLILKPIDVQNTTKASASATVDTTHPQISPEQAVILAFNKFETTDKGLRLSNSRYTMDFSPKGLRLKPQASDMVWQWRLTHIGTAEISLDGLELDQVSPNQQTQLLASYPRGGVVEQYVVNRHTVEQRFVIPQPLPLDGADLMIAGAVSSSGELEDTAQGWLWRTETGVVTLGKVTVFDAKGQILPSTMTVKADSTRIVVDGASLAQAAYPVTVDPEIGANDFRISDMGPDGDASFAGLGPPDVAYNSTNNEYLVVWTGSNTGSQVPGDFISGEFEIFGQRIDASTGTELGINDFRISDMGPEGNIDFDAFSPHVAYNSTNNEYLVVWLGDDNTGGLVDEEEEIFGQRLDAATGAEIGINDFRISDMGPDGDLAFGAFEPYRAYNSINNEYLIVWTARDTSSNLESEIFGQRLDAATGAEIGINDFRISDMGLDGDFTVTAFTPRAAYNSINNEYLVVWTSDEENGGSNNGRSDGAFDIFGQRLDAATGAEIGANDFRISDMGPDGDLAFGAFVPNIAYNSTNNEYLVVWRGDDNTGSLVDEEFEYFGQRLDAATGAEIGANDFRISDMGPDGDTSFGPFATAAIYNTVNSEYLVVWDSNDDIGALASDEIEIFGQRLTATGAIFTVTNTLDSGSGSLRDAILAANATPGMDFIEFAIPGAGPHTIQPASPLPEITDPVVIDATTQPGTDCTAGDLRIELDGQSAGDIALGLSISGGSSTVSGLAFNGFLDGIALFSNGGNTIECNFISTDIAGNSFGILLGAPNNTIIGNRISGYPAGVLILNTANNTIGGAVGNLIHNNFHGIQQEGDSPVGTMIVGNRIENNLTEGIWLRGGAIATNTNNCISGNGADGLQNTTGIITIAENNWWGHPSGPSGAGPGLGDSISSDVDAIPFLDTPPPGCETLTLSADLTVAISESSDPVTAGSGPGNLTYQVTATNNGPDPATGITIDIATTLPAGVSVDSVTPSGGAFNDPVWSIDNLGVNASATLTIVLTVGATATAGTDAIGVTAAVTGADQVLINTDDDSATERTSVVAQAPEPMADLSITQQDSPDPVSAGGTLTYTITVQNNGPSSAQNVTVTDALPAGVSFVSTSGCGEDPAGVPTCMLGTVAAGNSAQYTINATVNSGTSGTITNSASVTSGTADPNAGNNTATASTTIFSAPPPAPPLSLTPASTALPAGQVGEAFQETFTGSGGTPPLTLSGSGAPPGLSFTQQGDSLVLSGTPTQAGTFSLTITLTDSADPVQTVTRTFTLTIAAPLALEPASPNLPEAQVGEAFQATFTGSGGTPPLTLSGSGAPPGLSFTQQGDSLVLSGTPTQAGTFSLTITLTDSASPLRSLQRVFNLIISLELMVLPDMPRLPDGKVGEEYIVSFDVGNGVPPDTFAAIGPLPPGLALIEASLTGTPTDAGDFVVTIQATDSQGNTGMRDYELRILPEALTILDETLPTGVVGASYQAQLTALGGTGPFIWQAVSALPPGLTLLPDGLITGIPQQTGMFEIIVNVQDAQGDSTTASFSLQINAEGLVNLTPDLPDALVGSFYDMPIIVSGGQPPLRCELSGGELPPGLVLDESSCTISGTPTVEGTFDVVITVSDSAVPPNQLTIETQIRVALDTPIPTGAPPEFRATVDVPVPELGRGSPGTGFTDEALQQAAVDAFGNRYLVGFAYNGSSYDIQTLKYDAGGRLVWRQSFDSGGQDRGFAVTVSPADQSVYVGGFVLVGSEFQALLLKYDFAGVFQWQLRYDVGRQANAFYDLAADASGVYASGEHFNGNNFDGLIVHYSPTGELRWEALRETGDTETAYQVATAPCTDDRRLACALLVGGSEGAALSRGWLNRYNPVDGMLESAQPVSDFPVQALALAGDDPIIGGTNAVNDWRIARLDRDFQTRWSIVHPPGERLRAVAVDREGFIYAAGRRRNADGSTDGLILLLDGAGQPLSEFPFDQGADEQFNEVLVGPAGRLTATGERSGPGGTRFLLLNLDTGKSF